MCTAWASETEWNLFPLWSNTAFTLTLQESVKSLHCPEVCSSYNSSINAWMLFQYTKSPINEEYVAMSDCLSYKIKLLHYSQADSTA
jgi:hypothetical protein